MWREESNAMCCVLLPFVCCAFFFTSDDFLGLLRSLPGKQGGSTISEWTLSLLVCGWRINPLPYLTSFYFSYVDQSWSRLGFWLEAEWEHGVWQDHWEAELQKQLDSLMTWSIIPPATHPCRRSSTLVSRTSIQSIVPILSRIYFSMVRIHNFSHVVSRGQIQQHLFEDFLLTCGDCLQMTLVPQQPSLHRHLLPPLLEALSMSIMDCIAWD